MSRMKTLLLLFATVMLVSACMSNKTDNTEKDIADYKSRVFPIPYFPRHETSLLGHPVTWFSKTWESACVYSKEYLNDEEVVVYDKHPESNQIQSGFSVEADIDADGRVERVNWGAYKKISGEVGNFFLVTRGAGDALEKVYKREFPGNPNFSGVSLSAQSHVWVRRSYSKDEEANVLSLEYSKNKGFEIIESDTVDGIRTLVPEPEGEE